jgi:cellulose synthase/poly-beta-1,6-N-acetylglucosamine synthase-like glycosyltransferase
MKEAFDEIRVVGIHLFNERLHQSVCRFPNHRFDLLVFVFFGGWPLTVSFTQRVISHGSFLYLLVIFNLILLRLYFSLVIVVAEAAQVRVELMKRDLIELFYVFEMLFKDLSSVVGLVP